MINANGKRLSQRRVRVFGYKSNDLFIAKGSSISAEMNIGFGTRVNGRLIAKGRGKVNIGRYCAIGDGVRIITQNHSVEEQILSLQLQQLVHGRLSIEAADVEIGHNVWIGDSVIILPGVNIGSSSVIGAGTVVTNSVQDYDVVAGNPGRVIRNRFKENVHLSDIDWESSPEQLADVIRKKNL